MCALLLSSLICNGRKINALVWCLAVLSGAPADVTNVEHSMHSGLPTIILSDTGGTADAVALKLNESLKDKKELEEEEAKRKIEEAARVEKEKEIARKKKLRKKKLGRSRSTYGFSTSQNRGRVGVRKTRETSIPG